MEKLEAKDIAGYLPWGLNGIIEMYKSTTKPQVELLGIYERKPGGYPLFVKHPYFRPEGVQMDDFIPLLHPMSDIITEIEHKGERFVPMNRLIDMITQKGDKTVKSMVIEDTTAIVEFEPWKHPKMEQAFENFFEVDLDPNEVMFSMVSETHDNTSFSLCGNEFKMFQQLYAWHFDVSGLIGKKLARDINTVK